MFDTAATIIATIAWRALSSARITVLPIIQNA